MPELKFINSSMNSEMEMHSQMLTKILLIETPLLLGVNFRVCHRVFWIITNATVNLYCEKFSIFNINRIFYFSFTVWSRVFKITTRIYAHLHMHYRIGWWFCGYFFLFCKCGWCHWFTSVCCLGSTFQLQNTFKIPLLTLVNYHFWPDFHFETNISYICCQQLELKCKFRTFKLFPTISKTEVVKMKKKSFVDSVMNSAMESRLNLILGHLKTGCFQEF